MDFDDETVSPGRTEAWWATRRTWDVTADRRAFEMQGLRRPTLTAEMARLDAAMGQRLIDGVIGRSCAFVESQTFGLDGVSYELEWFQSQSGLKVSWWGSGPAEWRELTHAAEGILDELAALDWAPIPPVQIEAYWEMSVPFEHELMALRKLVPRLAALPMAELWSLAKKRPLPIGTMPLEQALELQAKADGMGLRLNLELPS